MHESENEVTQPCPTLSDSMDCSPPGFTVHGIFQARVLGWGAIAFSACWGEDLIKGGVSWPGKPFDINCQNVLSCRTPELLTRDDFLNKRVAWWRCNKGLCYEVGGQGTGRTSRISEQRTLLNKQHHHHQQKPEQNCQKQWPIVVVKKHATVEKHIQEYLLNLSDSVVNIFACKAKDNGSNPGSRRYSGEANGNPLQYSCLGNPMDRADRGYGPGGFKESDMWKESMPRF